MVRIGEFSQLVQMSVRMLRYYDEIGLLRPAHVDAATGYRSYTSAQLADVHRITALRGLGLSLDLVQQLLRDEVSIEDIAAMLRLEQARAEQVRADADHRLTELRRRLAEIRDLGSLSTVEVVEKPVPALPCWSRRTTVTDVAAAERLVQAALTVGAGLTGRPPVLVVGHAPFYDTANLDIEVGFPVAGPLTAHLGDGRGLAAGPLPAVARMLTVVQLAEPIDGHHRVYRAIATWLETHHCHIVGPVREVIRPSDRLVEPATVEIQYPVARPSTMDRSDPGEG